MRDFPLTDQLKAILADPACAEWMLPNVKHGAGEMHGEEAIRRVREDNPAAYLKVMAISGGVDRVFRRET